MKFPTGIYYSESDKALMRDRWEKGESLSAFGIVAFAANAIVDREDRVAPLQHALGEAGIQHALIAEEVEYLQPQGPVRSIISNVSVTFAFGGIDAHLL